MFTVEDIKEKSTLFLNELYLQTEGEPSNTVSMYDIGETLGLDRAASSRTAEELIGTGLAEIKTLSGGIGITADGVTEAQQSGAESEGEGDSGTTLGDELVLDGTRCEIVERVSAELKGKMGEKNLHFDALAELTADLKSIDSQMSSPNPKTAIIRECFRSIRTLLLAIDDTAGVSSVNRLLGE